jgi:hypothetical protein
VGLREDPVADMPGSPGRASLCRPRSLIGTTARTTVITGEAAVTGREKLRRRDTPVIGPA